MKVSIYFLSFLFCVVFSCNHSFSQGQRVILPFDQRINSLGNLHFSVNNYGQIGFDSENQRAGFLWQNDSTNAKKDAKINYIFGMGTLFSAKKKVGGELQKYVVSSFDINENRKIALPGRR